MSRRRLLAITHDYSSSGAPIVLFHMLTGLTGDYDILLVGQDDGPMRQEFLSAGITSIVLPNTLVDPNISGHLLLSHDMLLANTVMSFLSIVVAGHLKKPSLWYLHEGQFGAQFLQQSPVITSAFELADCIGYAGDFQKALYAPWRGTKRTELIRYGVESHDAGSSDATDQTAQPSTVHVLLLGSFEVRKGHDIALSAFRMLNDANLQLHMVGRVNNQTYYTDVMEHFKDVRNARYFNEVPKDSTKALLRAADIVVVPSRDEVTPLVILEAMALGKPVIASAICGIPEMITDGQTGFLFESGNAAQLATLIARLAGDSDLRSQLGANARRCQREHWTIERSCQRFREVLGTLA